MGRGGRQPISLVAFTVSGSHLLLIGEAALRADISHPELCVIPGHVGVVPGDPRQLGAILAQARA